MTTVTIDPATRLEGHLKVEVTSAGGVVTDAHSSGMMFRGFENLLIGKDPRDAAHVTQRICGVCPTNHAMAACLAMEAAAGITAPANARVIRNLILGADFLHSHILHFYHLAVPSFVQGPAMPPWTPTYSLDMRFSAAESQALVGHYLEALVARRQAHEMGAILAGRLPHTVAYEFGGVTVVPNADLVTRFRTYLDAVTAFIDGAYTADVDALAARYPDYYDIGRGNGNLLAFGVFDLDDVGTSKLLARGRWADAVGAVQAVDLAAIVEQARYSWYSEASGGLNPAVGVTEASADKADAYSWLKAPRYNGVPYEVGALARMWVAGDYRRGISVMDRHQARVKEASKIAHAMYGWLDQLNFSGQVFKATSVPTSGLGVGLTEAPRGALGHWLAVSNQAVTRYQILTPTCWNCSPRDAAGVVGPLEAALAGTPMADATQPVEVLRVVQSFDPCLSCAVH